MTAVQPITTGPPGYTTTLPCEAEAAGIARLMVVAALNTWVLGELTDTGKLVVSELVGNAVRHTSCCLLKISVQRRGTSRVRICVTDTSQRTPNMGGGDRDEEGGRGLLLIDALADRRGYDQHGGGRRTWKTVWAELVVEDEMEAER